MARLYSFKCNMAATAAPAVTDDVDLGYVVGSRWFDVTNDKEYVCLDNADGAAVWTETTQSGGAGDVSAAANLTDKALIVGSGGAKGVASLALGAANLKLFMNAAGTANEYANGMKIGLTSHDATVTGTQEITGIGFKPSYVDFLAVISTAGSVSVGFDNGTLAYTIGGTGEGGTAGDWTYDLDDSIYLVTGSNIRAYAHITTLGADGFTITWGKDGSPTGSIHLIYKAYR